MAPRCSTATTRRRSIPALLERQSQWCITTGQFELYVTQRAVSYKNMIAVDDVNTVLFLQNPAKRDPRTFDNPAPPTAERLAAVIADLTAKGKPTPTALTAIPAALEKTYFLAPHPLMPSV